MHCAENARGQHFRISGENSGTSVQQPLRSRPTRAREIVEDLAHWMPVDTTIGLVQQAWHWTDTAQLSYWDALILAAAQRAGAGYLLSEDFQPNRRDQDVVVLNPFDHSASEFGL